MMLNILQVSSMNNNKQQEENLLCSSTQTNQQSSNYLLSSETNNNNIDLSEQSSTTDDSSCANSTCCDFSSSDAIANSITTTTIITSTDDSSSSSSSSDDDQLSKCGYPKRVRSLVDDAKFDTIKNRELDEERRWLYQRQLERQQSKQHQADSLSSDSLNSFGEEQQTNGSPIETEIETSATATAVEEGEEEVECLLLEPEVVQGTGTKLLDGKTATSLMLSGWGQIVDFPRHISQLDQCHHLLIKYEPELDPTHPGFHDPEYRERRKSVAQIAFNYKYGQKIPEVAYNSKEIDTWRYIYIRLKDAYSRYACQQHNSAIEQLERECGYSPNSIPQLERVSDFLERKTGWRLRPAAGLLSARDFLASLAFRVFQTTQYIRHWGNPEHSVEPDCIHELMGHIPMLCDPSFAQFSQEIGLASLGASDEQIEKFATLYWFTVEFGLCREQGQLKCYGAGLLSSFGEMEHALESGKPELKEFVPEETAIESYDDAEYQVTYYVAESFDDAKLKIKQYAQKNLKRDFELVYEPYSCTIRVLDNIERLDLYADAIKNDVMHLSSAISKLRLKQQQQESSSSSLLLAKSVSNCVNAIAEDEELSLSRRSSKESHQTTTTTTTTAPLIGGPMMNGCS